MADENRPIIIKKIKKGGHGHHGGAWKVAYADFVTAMMAFFLLLWLLNATTDEQKLGISNFFSPDAVSEGNSGSGGLFGGTTLNLEGALTSSGGPSEGAVVVPLPTTPAAAGDSDGEGASGDEEPLDDPAQASVPPEEVDEQTLEELLAEREQEQFERAEEVLRQAIQSVPELAELQNSLIIEQTPEGMRIQLVDQERVSMFASGSSEPADSTRRLAKLVTEVIKQLPNRLSISGHTDAVPYSSANGYTNWELSAERANAARRLLIESGLSPDRLALVQGLADTDPLLPDDPNSARNRRISFVLLRENSGEQIDLPPGVELQESVGGAGGSTAPDAIPFEQPGPLPDDFVTDGIR